MSFFDKIKNVVEEHKSLPLLRAGVHKVYEEIEGLVDPDHRHDNPAEKERDRIRAEINKSHRFESFAQERQHATVKWHIDGHDYFWALSEILDSAKEVIFILDWWLTPEVYLRRPPAYYPEWRLDRLLLRKARQGVKIFIVVYKEISATMTLNSAYTKHTLEALHHNIVVMRHPDHIGTDSDVEFWSHHEKVVVVDNHKACIGGLDICFGRWDTSSHPLVDAHPTQFFKTLFPGQDYNDARFRDFQEVDHPWSNTISVREQPRMPWQDCHMTIVGPVVLDVTQHFIERWNEIKRRKYHDDRRFEWLAFPHDVNAAPNEAIVRHPHRESWLATGRRFKQRWHGEYAPPDDEEGYPPHGTCNVQVVRSVSDWSHGVLTEHSIQNAYIQLIREAVHFIYIENQFFISNTGSQGPVKNRIAEALVQRIISAAREGKKFRVIVVFPEVPSFAGSLETTSIKTILAAQYRTINRGGHSIYEEIRKAGYDPTDYIRFYHLRTYDRINAPASLVESMEKRSGVEFEQAEVALARQWLGPDHAQPDYKVKIKTVATKQGDLSTMDTSEMKQQVKEVRVPQTLQESGNIIRQFENGATRSDHRVSDSVSQHVQLDRTPLRQEEWLGTREEERNAYVSNMVYIHTKLMIVDDSRVIMGSANFNDRSQRGDGDSEIALVVEDTDMIPSRMDGRPSRAGRFSASLRRKLFRKHLGLIEPQICSSDKDPITSFMRPSPIPNYDESHLPETEIVIDPLDEGFWSRWNKTAEHNQAVFSEIFHHVPSNRIHTWSELKESLPKVTPGHVANESLSLESIKAKLSEVKGHLVAAPLDFLIGEKELTSDDTIDWRGFNFTLPIYI